MMKHFLTTKYWEDKNFDTIIDIYLEKKNVWER